VDPTTDPNVDSTGTPEVLPLWPGRAPGAVGDDARDRPTLTVYRPFGRKAGDPPTAAVVVAPGGGYAFLATNHEGRQVANSLNALGVTAFVLRYRVGPRYRHPVPLGDARRALRLVRARAAEFGVRPDQVGVLGFSAGGHLAATAATRFDAGRPADADPVERAGSRPDFVVLGYPVISFDAPYAHRGSGDNLLGPNADPRLVASLSADRNVTAQTPPAFLVHTNEDDGVPPENSLAFYQALRRARVPAELHVFERGPHGLGLGGEQPGYAEWPRLLAVWMRGRGLLPPPRR
jgi:acetyl esterase/lipase